MNILGFSDGSYGEWILILASVVGLLAGVVHIANFFRAKPPLHQQYADKKDTDARITQIEENIVVLRREQQEQYREIIHAGELRAHSLHERINTVLAAVSELKGEIKHLS